MSAFYKVVKADPLGEPYTPNFAGAKPTQSYWCQVEGQSKDVMIGKQVRDDGQPALTAGQHIYGDLMLATSQKGNEYLKFKSAKVPEGVERPADSPAQATAQAATQPNVSDAVPAWFTVYGNMIEYVYKEIKQMNVSEESNQPDVPFASPGDALEPVSEETQAKLDAVFGEPEPPADYPDDIGAKG